MKHVDAFLKKLKTDRNTFATYILLMFSIYIVVDRFVEILLIGTTGMSVSYWGPIKYTLAVACLIFTLEFSFSSKFVSEDVKKLSFFYIFVIGFFIVVVSMIIQWINKLAWILFFSVPNYSYIIQNFFELVKPAMSAVAWYIPITTFYPAFKFCCMTVNDTKDIKDSIFDCPGIDLSDNKKGWGPYTCEMFICKDSETGKLIKIPESRRFESTLAVGVSGSGKTSMVFEPMLARDLEKKFFFRETAKELGYTALRTGLATLSSPYSNDYLNKNFTLEMLVPVQNKEKLYKAFLSKMFLSDKPPYTYKNLGITYMAPDYESISHMTEVADNFGIPYSIIDPNNMNSIGLNPFVYKDPIKASLAISAIFNRLYASDLPNYNGMVNSSNSITISLARQAIENLVILLKLIYPKVNDGALPNLEDLYNMMNNFTLVEKATKILEADADLAEQYQMQINYLKSHFFAGSENIDKMHEIVASPSAQIEKLLRHPGVKAILCNRYNNKNYDDVLKNGEVVFVCTRRGDLGQATQKAFGIFFILLMQQSVLSRPGTERTRVPHFFYIDEFTPFIDDATMDIFTLYRKYRVGAILSAQNLAQIGSKESPHRQTILANSTTKMVFGNNTPEDNDWWREEFGDKREWTWTNNYHTSGAKTPDGQPGYDESYNGISYKWKKNYEAGKIQSLKFKQIIYKTRDTKGKMIVGKAKLDFLESRYKDEQKIKNYNFSKFIQGVSVSSKKDEEKEKKFDFSNVDFSSNNPDLDGPIARNPNRSFESNKTGANYVNPIKSSDKNLNQAINDYNNNDDENKE
jgi:hypothetical protein